jgi:hypothetical protein
MPQAACYPVDLRIQSHLQCSRRQCVLLVLESKLMKCDSQVGNQPGGLACESVAPQRQNFKYELTPVDIYAQVPDIPVLVALQRVNESFGVMTHTSRS